MKAPENEIEEETSSGEQAPETDSPGTDSSGNEQHPEEPEGDIAEMSAEELTAALVAAREEVQELKDGFLRAKAEMENIRRRSQNEVVAARKYAVEGFAGELLNVLDSLDQAAQVKLDEAEDGAVTSMKEGLELTLKQMQSALNKFGVTEVEASQGVKFDPECHQAISMVPSEDVESNQIIEVMQKGFMLKDRLIRPAMVVVAS